MAKAVTGLVKRPVKIKVRRGEEILMDQIFQTTPIRIGRMLDNDLALPFDFVSRYHCELRFENETWVAVDLGSKNGFLVENQTGDQVHRERQSSLPLHDGASFFIQELSLSLEFMEKQEFTQSFSSQRGNHTDTMVEEMTPEPSILSRPMVEVDLQSLLFIPHSGAGLARERALQMTAVWHDQVLDSKEFAIGEPIEWEFIGHVHELGRVGRDQTPIRVPKGCKAVEGSEVPLAKGKKAQVTARLETPTAFTVNENLFVYFRYVPKSRELPKNARFIDDRMMDPLMFSSAVHGTAALTALVLGSKPHAPVTPAQQEPERFATIIMPKPDPVPLATPEPQQVAAQPTPEPTPLATPLPEKPKPEKKIAKVPPPPVKAKKVVEKKVERKVALARKEDPPPVKQVAQIPPAEKVAPAAAPAAPAPPATTPQPFNAKSVGALKAFALLKPGPASTNLANIEKIQVSRAPASVQGSVMGAEAVQGTGEILTKLSQSSRTNGSGTSDAAAGVAVGGKSAGGEYKVAGLSGKAGNRKIKGSVLGGATYTELSKNDGLTREQVMKEVQKHQSEIQRCYETALMRNPDLSGSAEFEWEIDPKGPVTTAKVKSATVKNGEGLLDCVKGVFAKMVFPKAKNGESTNSTINLPFGRL